MAKQWRSVCRVTGFLIPARPWASWKARLSERGVTGSKAFKGLGNSHAGGRVVFHHSRSVVRSWGESSASRSRRPLPCCTRIRIRSLSISLTFSPTTSDARNPAPYATLSAVRHFKLGVAAKSREISLRVSTTGSRWGCRAIGM